MRSGDLIHFKKWFNCFVRSYYSDNPEDQKNIVLKEEHTAKVCGHCVRIAEEESFGDNGKMLAETVGLFHDVGRFPQYAKYRTFRDNLSVNHGELGMKTLVENRVLFSLSEREQEIISTAVKFHNAFKVPDIDDNEILRFIRIIRDADKLDIWRIFSEYYGSPPGERPSAVGLDLLEEPHCSPEVLDRIFKFQLIPLAILKTVNDFKLTTLSWIYDLNFASSLRIVHETDCIGRMAKLLPQSEEIRGVIALLHNYIERRVQGGMHV